MYNIKDVLSGVLSSLQDPEKKKKSRLQSSWTEIAGPKIAPHTRPWLGREGRLTVWVDQSTLAFELSQKYRQSLLKRTQAVLGEDEVKSIYFRVGQIR